MLVFVPLAPADLAGWAGTQGVRDVTGFAATPAFLDAFGLASPDAEDTDLTLLEIAALDGLLRHGVRLVAVCEAHGVPVEPADFGAVRADAVRWGSVHSLFADDPDAAARATGVRALLGDADLATAWESDAAAGLLADLELAWHGSTEWERLTH